MKIAALVAWLVTASGGAVLLARWVSKGGARASTAQPPSQFPPALIFGHLALAVAGLAVWIAYLAAGSATLAWVSFALLLLIAVLGFVMLGRWARARRALAGAPAATPGTGTQLPAEQHFPVPIVVAHGVLAVTTVVLVLLAALGAQG